MSSYDGYLSYTLYNDAGLLREEADLPIIPEGRMWVSHRGEHKIVAMESMTKEHLLATISMVERGFDYLGDKIPDWCSTKLDYLKEEAARRGLEPKEDGWDI